MDKIKRPITPSEKIEFRDEQERKIEQEYNQFADDVNKIASTTAGQRLFSTMARGCGFGQPKVATQLVNGNVIPIENTTIYNCARESVYLEIRAVLTPENKMKIEKDL